MAQMRLEISRDGVREAALTSPEVRAAVRQAAEAIAARATGPDAEIKIVDAGTSRARSYVVNVSPKAAAAEAKYRILGRALGGG